jgi:hypothetical protein
MTKSVDFFYKDIPHGDATDWYDVILNGEFKVAEFIEIIFNTRSGEYGSFYVKRTAFGELKRVGEYRDGIFTSAVDTFFHNRRIASVRANGSQAHMSYYITLEGCLIQ